MRPFAKITPRGGRAILVGVVVTWFTKISLPSSPTRLLVTAGQTTETPAAPSGPATRGPSPQLQMPDFPKLRLTGASWGKPAPAIVALNGVLVPALSYVIATASDTASELLATALPEHQRLLSLGDKRTLISIDTRISDPQQQWRQATLLSLFPLSEAVSQLTISDLKTLPLPGLSDHPLAQQPKPHSNFAGITWLNLGTTTIITASQAVETQVLTTAAAPTDLGPKLAKHLSDRGTLMVNNNTATVIDLMAQTATGAISIDGIWQAGSWHLTVASQMPMQESTLFKSHKAMILASLGENL